MTEKHKSPATPGRVEGREKKKLNYEDSTFFSTKLKDLIVEAAARGFIPPKMATFALTLLGRREVS